MEASLGNARIIDAFTMLAREVPQAMPIVPAASRTLFVCHQHILPTLQPLMAYIASALVPPENVFLLGKPYSTIRAVSESMTALGVQLVENRTQLIPGRYAECIRRDVDLLWQAVLQRDNVDNSTAVVILDEGGVLTSSVPQRLIGKTVAVEQTQFGARRSDIRVPTVQVATSAAKRHFESGTITDGIWQRLTQEGKLRQGQSYGVIGLGFLGFRLARRLHAAGFNVLSFDPRLTQRDVEDLQLAPSIDELLAASQVVIGCSGFDAVPPRSNLRPGAELISVSSSDIEFSGLLIEHRAIRTRLHSPIQLKPIGEGPVIANGGFPYNFDGVREYEDPADILLTRLLMIAGVGQALRAGPSGRLKLRLDAGLQHALTAFWARHFSTHTHNIPDDRAWWIENSNPKVPAQ